MIQTFRRSSSSAGAVVGRFAPTPSGPLHMGSLVAALASYLEARHAGGQWRLRIDDLDAPRCDPAADAIIRQQLEAHALDWDGSVRRQSEHLDDYGAAYSALEEAGVLYACCCTRKQLQREGPTGPDGAVYPGHCRTRGLGAQGNAMRVALGNDRVSWSDAWQGSITRNPATEIGDFIVRRRDGQIAYQLACVVDDADQGITQIVRGADLIGSTARQCALRRALQLSDPSAGHIPLLTDANGKLSKQHHAKPIANEQAADNLRLCLGLLGQTGAPDAAPAEIVAWAREAWRRDRVPTASTVALDQNSTGEQTTGGG